MAEKHPTELELLAFVEEELRDDARRDVGEHLVACRPCADQIRRLEAAREALRSAAPLELPDERRAEIFASLPDRRDPWRHFRPAKRALVVAAPIAAAAALVAVFFISGGQLGSTGDDDAGEAAEATMDAAADEGGAEEGADTTLQPEAAPAQAAPPGTTFVLLARGPAAEIVRVLAGEGITAEVDPGGGVVAEARAGEVRAALAGRATGDVPVYVR